MIIHLVTYIKTSFPFMTEYYIVCIPSSVYSFINDRQLDYFLLAAVDSAAVNMNAFYFFG